MSILCHTFSTLLLSPFYKENVSNEALYTYKANCFLSSKEERREKYGVNVTSKRSVGYVLGALVI